MLGSSWPTQNILLGFFVCVCNFFVSFGIVLLFLPFFWFVFCWSFLLSFLREVEKGLQIRWVGRWGGAGVSWRKGENMVKMYYCMKKLKWTTKWQQYSCILYIINIESLAIVMFMSLLNLPKAFGFLMGPVCFLNSSSFSILVLLQVYSGESLLCILVAVLLLIPVTVSYWSFFTQCWGRDLGTLGWIKIFPEEVDNILFGLLTLTLFSVSSGI